MRVDEAFPGNWLKSSDLGEEDHVVTIQSVESQMVGSGEQAKLKLVAKFREFPKPLVVNLTNAKTIAKLHGDDTDDWIGKRVTLWVNPDVTFGGETVSAIRVRARAPQGKVAGQPQQHGDGVLSFDEALKLAATVNIDKAGLVDYLKQQGRTSWNSRRDSQLVRELVAGFSAGDNEFGDEVEPPPDDDSVPF